MASSDSARLLVRSLWISSALCALKAATGICAGSLGLLASALDSLMDLCSSAVNLVSLNIARSPADQEHQYGHGKAEALAGLFQGSFIALGGLGLLLESARRLIAGSVIEHHRLSIAVMLLATGVSLAHGVALRRAARREESNILGAEGAHYLSDVAANLGVAGALALAGVTGRAAWDPVVTAIIVGYVLWLAAPIIVGSIRELMDEGLPNEVLDEIERIIRAHHPSVSGFHNFRSRRAGNRRYIEFHLELKGVREFVEAHDITESLVDKIRTAVPNSDVLIHTDPEGGR